MAVVLGIESGEKMRAKVIVISVLLFFGIGVIAAVKLGYIESSGLKMTMGFFAVWALGSALKIVVESRKKK